MKRALALGAVLAVAGCSGGTPTAAPAPTVTVTVTETAAPAPTVTVTEEVEVPAPTVTVTEEVEVPGPTRTVTKEAAPPARTSEPVAPTSSGLSDGSFTATTPRGLSSQFGTCRATARVTNTSDSEKTAVVTFTVFKGSDQVGTLQGTVNQVGAGDTATVTLLSQNKCPTGSLRYEFQVDAEF